MNAREKARQLIEKYANYNWSNPIELMKERTKQCALIAVEEVLQQLVWMHAAANTEFMRTFISDQNDYWKEVKQEIEKL